MPGSENGFEEIKFERGKRNAGVGLSYNFMVDNG
jgi:hypothetical protein